MRLLNTETLEFREFLGANIPNYAILSHVWSDEEVSYDDYLQGKGKDSYGHRKILNLCRLARELPILREPLQWAWIDTCCIDKRSSAELTEAINSMYKWYENAKVCFAFLPDVEPSQSAASEPSFSEQKFLASRWFTRGWTLQELLAPGNVLFFNTAFELFGRKNTFDDHHVADLSSLISQTTGITIDALIYALSDFCIAQRMSWVSNRQTTREEDLAYCLLGLFDVNMPLLYGEGFSKAFLRLQTEVIAKSTDESIFAWDVIAERQGRPSVQRPSFGLLAPSPQYFRNCGDVSEIVYVSHSSQQRLFTKRLSYTMSRRGTDVSMPVASTGEGRAGRSCKAQSAL